MVGTVVGLPVPPWFSIFFFNDTATTEIYTLSLHDALPISFAMCPEPNLSYLELLKTSVAARTLGDLLACQDRKSTRLNSSHQIISYAVFCLKKKILVFSEIYTSSSMLFLSCDVSSSSIHIY